MSSERSILYATGWMLLALSLFSLLAVGVKELTGFLNAPQILLYRNLLALVIITTLIALTSRRRFKTAQLKKHIIRNSAHFAGQYGWVYGIAFLPLAEVFALEFTTPIWTALIAATILKEKLSHARLVSIIIGFAGVLIILRPGIEIVHPAAIAVLLGAAAYGITHVTTKSLSVTDTPLTIIFYMTLVQTPLALIFSVPDLQLPAGVQWGWLIVIAIAGLLAHFAMSRALIHADAMVVVPIDYLRLPLIMLVGFIFYNEPVGLFLVLGSVLMISGNFYGLRGERNR